MTTSNTNYDRQHNFEVEGEAKANAAALAEFHNNLAKGNEHKNSAYSVDAINALTPTIHKELVSLVDLPGQHPNKFWWEELRPLIKAQAAANARNAKALEETGSAVTKTVAMTITNMIVLNLVATLSQETSITTLATKMTDAAYALLNIDYMLRDHHKEQTQKFFLGCICLLRDKGCEVFNFERVGEDAWTVKSSAAWVERVQDAADKVKAFKFSYEAMVCEPIDQVDLLGSAGGHVYFKTPVLKETPFINNKIHSAITSFTAETNPSFFALFNAAQKTPYQVNSKLLEVIEAANGVGKFFADYPTDIKQVENAIEEWAAEAIEELSSIYPEVFASSIRKENAQAKAKGKEMVRKTTDIMKKAKKLKEEAAIYFPLYCCERGRFYTYVHTGSLSYMGGELAKALLVFANKEVLNDDGVAALFHSLGNCLGFDKHSLADKLVAAQEFWNTNKADFLNDDFNIFFDQQGEFEEPINALAICVELTAWTKDPKHLCGYMAHRDARCSGSSIIGTLFGDRQAMTLTSVIDTVKDGTGKLPDAYTFVANTGRELNTESYFEEHADLLFSRKTWKTPVMTRGSYGATRYTIHSGKKSETELFSKTGNEAMFRKNGLDMTKANKFTNLMMKTLDASLPSCSLYLESIKEAAEASIVESGCYLIKSPITGFPMVRRKNARKKSSLESPARFDRLQLVIYIYNKNKMDKQKLLNAIGPDTIHSIDAALLMRVRELMGDVNMATVHDSIAVSINETGRMVSAYAQAMYELKANDVIGNIYQQLGATAPTIDNITTEELNDIKNSKHILA